MAHGSLTFKRFGSACKTHDRSTLYLLDRARTPLTQICEAALANQIETDFVGRLIEIKRLSPPPLAEPHWPWPVHVRTLGGFRLDIHGKRYRPSHKAQDKPLELLKLLVTCQALGRDSAEKAWISKHLWPDADADNARKWLDMTVGRLRRLLDNEDSVVTHEGQLQLSPCFRLDGYTASAPRYLARSVPARPTCNGHNRSRRRNGGEYYNILDNYTGPFLANKEGPAGLLAGREAIAARVRQALLAADAMLEGAADALLIPALERAFAAEPTSEDLAQALMRAHYGLGQNSEAIRVYRQLREMLSLLLSIAPSRESDDIRDRAYAAESKKIADVLP